MKPAILLAYEKGFMEAAEIIVRVASMTTSIDLKTATASITALGAKQSAGDNRHCPGPLVINCADTDSGWTALHWAAFRNHSAGIEALLLSDPTGFATCDQRGMHPFHVACAHVESLSLMLAHIYSQPAWTALLFSMGWTAAMETVAVACGLISVESHPAQAPRASRDTIRTWSLETWSRGMQNGITAVHFLAGFATPDCLHLLRYIPTAVWKLTDQLGQTPLHWAAQVGNHHVLQEMENWCQQGGHTSPHGADSAGDNHPGQLNQSFDHMRGSSVPSPCAPFGQGPDLEMQQHNSQLGPSASSLSVQARVSHDSSLSTGAHAQDGLSASRTSSLDRTLRAPAAGDREAHGLARTCDVINNSHGGQALAIGHERQTASAPVRLTLTHEPPDVDQWKAVDSLQRTSLHLAAYSGCVRSTWQVLRMLHESDVVEQRDEQGLTAMHHAAMSGSVAVIDLLAESGHPVDLPDSQLLRTPLLVAVSTGQEDAACALLLQGADCLSSPSDQQTGDQELDGLDVFSPLHHGIRGKMWRFVDLAVNMLFRQSDEYRRSRQHTLKSMPSLADAVDCKIVAPSITWLASRDARFGRGCFARLLDDGREDEVYCMLREACATGFELLVQLLCKCFGELVRHPPEGFQFTALHSAARHGRSACVRLLAKAGADILAGDKNLDTPLHWAAFMGHIGTVSTLLQLGADIHQTNRDGGTSLHSAANHGAVGVGQILIAAGSDTNLRMRDGNAPLHNSSYEGHTEFVGILLDNGADAACRNDEGRTPLHEAACNGHADVIKTLCRGGNRSYAEQLKQHLHLDSILRRNLHMASTSHAVAGSYSELIASCSAPNRSSRAASAAAESASTEARTQLQAPIATVGTIEGPGFMHSPRGGSDRDHACRRTVQTARAERHPIVAPAQPVPSAGMAHRVVAGLRNILNTLTPGSHRTEASNSASRRDNTHAPQSSMGPLSSASHSSTQQLVTTYLEWCGYGASMGNRNHPDRAAGMKSHEQPFGHGTCFEKRVPVALLSEVQSLAASVSQVLTLRYAAAHEPQQPISAEQSPRGVQADPDTTTTGVAFPQHRRAPLNAQDTGGDTALHWSVCNGHLSSTRELLRHGASVSVSNIDGGLPLHAAIINGHVECLRCLLNHGADPNSRFTSRPNSTVGSFSRGGNGVDGGSLGDTAALVACADGQVECLAMLLTAGASLRSVCSRSRTPLHEACRGRHIRCVEMILQHGVTLDSLDARGRPPLMLLLPYPPRPKQGSWSDALSALGSAPMSSKRKPRAAGDAPFVDFFLNPALSDVQLLSADGVHVPAHRIILSAKCTVLGQLVEHTIHSNAPIHKHAPSVLSGAGAFLSPRSLGPARRQDREHEPRRPGATGRSTSTDRAGPLNFRNERTQSAPNQYEAGPRESQPVVHLGINADVLTELLRFAYTGDVLQQPPTAPPSPLSMGLQGNMYSDMLSALKVRFAPATQTSGRMNAMASHDQTPGSSGRSNHVGVDQNAHPAGHLARYRGHTPTPELWLQLIEASHQFGMDDLTDVAIDRLNRPQQPSVLLAMHRLAILLNNARLRLVSVAQLCSVRAAQGMQHHINRKQHEFEAAQAQLLSRQRQRCRQYSELRSSLLTKLASSSPGAVCFLSPAPTVPNSPGEAASSDDSTSGARQSHHCWEPHACGEATAAVKASTTQVDCTDTVLSAADTTEDQPQIPTPAIASTGALGDINSIPAADAGTLPCSRSETGVPVPHALAPLCVMNESMHADSTPANVPPDSELVVGFSARRFLATAQRDLQESLRGDEFPLQPLGGILYDLLHTDWVEYRKRRNSARSRQFVHPPFPPAPPSPPGSCTCVAPAQTKKPPQDTLAQNTVLNNNRAQGLRFGLTGAERVRDVRHVAAPAWSPTSHSTSRASLASAVSTSGISSPASHTDPASNVPTLDLSRVQQLVFPQAAAAAGRMSPVSLPRQALGRDNM